MGKKTIYLSLYENGQKTKSAGFAQLWKTKEKIRITVNIKNTREAEDGRYSVCIRFGEETVQIGDVFLREGLGTFEKEFGTSSDVIWIKSENFQLEEMEEIFLILAEERKICGLLEAGSVVQRKNDKQADANAETEASTPIEMDVQDKVSKQSEVNAQSKMDVGQPRVEPERFFGNKWEQILEQYSNVHPFGDGRLFVSLELQDLVILPEKYQKLMHNSFLLHGFYNYRHIILGKDYKLGNGVEKCFYLGVPGVFFEREKQVAVMFGFEGFECAGAVEIGKFGYYVREVSI